MRITVPEGDHPVVYTTTKLGSPTLLQTRINSLAAALFNDSKLSPRERELIRIRFVLETDCNLCATTRSAQDFADYSDDR